MRTLITLAAALAVVSWSAVAWASLEPSRKDGKKESVRPPSKVEVFNREYNPIPDQDFEVRLDVGVIGGNHIGSDFDMGFRGGAEGVFPLADDIGLYGLTGVSVANWNGRTSMGLSLGAGCYGLGGFDTGLVFDWFHPDGSVNIYQVRAFFQTAFTPTDRFGLRMNVPIGKDTYDAGPYGIAWNFELAWTGGLFWQHSWLDEFASEVGFAWAGGDVDTALCKMALVYHYNEQMNFRLSAYTDFDGDEQEVALYVELKLGPGAVRKTAFDRMRFYYGGLPSYESVIMNIPYNKHAPEWDANTYW